MPTWEITESVHQALATRSLLPAIHLVDSGYTSAALLVAAAGQHIELMGPVRGDTTAQNRSGEGLGQDAFTVGWPARTVTCPRLQRSVSWSAQRKPTGTEIIRVHFAKADCDACPVRAACTSAMSKWGRNLTLLARPQQQALDQRRREQDTDQWQAAYGTRAGIEGTLSQAVRVTRTRTTPYRGLHKTRLGHVLIAAGLNFRRLDAWWTETPIGSTHISRFARLGLELTARPNPPTKSFRTGYPRRNPGDRVPLRAGEASSLFPEAVFSGTRPRP
ncbi:transposase [Streptomyces sp. ADMS]|uniref:transposase n=1 Tax=Streptomyces sp. ADMS TaxID=3071415 RepID=UPI00296E2CA7|nr:transposase [Streptomyces sp. ADMS]MDW4910594.1 transposase [Streptomyces sp. ADMS]